MNKNNKGFTLVELLSVIVIMGIILLVAVPSVFGISKTIKDNMYCTKVHNLESAAKLYGSDYQDDFDDKGYIKVDVKTIIDNNLYKKETDECTLGDEDKGCVVDPRDESVMDNKTITIVKTGQRFYAYYDFSNEEDIVLCEGKKETDKFKHYDVALDNQGATYPGTTIVRDVVFGHEMPNIEVPRKEYKVRLIDEYNHIDRTETVKYTFRGYFAAKNGGVKYYDESGKNVHYYNLPDGRPLYAVWTDKSINLPKQTLTGYEFRGWFTSRSGEDFIMESGNYIPTSDITLYARWIPKKVIITLNNQSATTKGTERIEATYNDAFPNITIPQKEYSVTLNYNGSTTPNTTLKSKNTFDGYWSQRNGKGTKYYDSTGKGIGVSKFTSNSTIYANWINGSITLPDASRTGYKLTGWYTAASGGTKVGNAGSKYNTSKNITLYAQWKAEEYVINLDSQNATSTGTTRVIANYGSPISKITPPSRVYTLNLDYNMAGLTNSNLRSTYTFNGYYTGVNGTGTKYINADGSSARNYDKTENLNLYAYWTGGSVVLPDSYVPYYKFEGWFTNSSGGIKIGNANTSYTITSNKTIYAHWTKLCPHDLGAQWSYDFTGNEQRFIAPCSGEYKLEVWGAQGTGDEGCQGGRGGYSTGDEYFKKEEPIYVYVGGLEGYNGGGEGCLNMSGLDDPNGCLWNAAGGGATHMAFTPGILPSYGNEINASRYVLLVAGGGGGCSDASDYGGAGGGDYGGNGNGPYGGLGATPYGGYAFGMGEPRRGIQGSAGGGGWYGGFANQSDEIGSSGGGGTGWIGGVRNGSMQSGVREFNGYARITLISIDQEGVK